MSQKEKKSGISRRSFIKGVGGGIVGTTAVTAAVSKCASGEVGPHGSRIRGPETINISLRINGKKHSLAIEPKVTLLDAITKSPWLHRFKTRM